MRAFVFPGQGSQKLGMGADLAAASLTARAVFQEVDESLSQGLFAIMSDGPEDHLTLPENAQPAIMTIEISTLRALATEFGLDMSAKGACSEGYSHGEYTALCG